jgi:Meiotically up-regulated gene 113
LQQKLDLPSVFPKLAMAVRHFKREPTTAELEMFRHNDATFPAYKSVINHFESKSEMMVALRQWVETSDEFTDVAKMLPAISAMKSKTRNFSTNEGFVYLIKSGNFFKIGRGDELEKRVKQIRTALPDASTLEHSIRTDDPAGIEAYWHRRFAEKRANGEWFKLSLSDITAFKRRKYQ